MLAFERGAITDINTNSSCCHVNLTLSFQAISLYYRNIASWRQKKIRNEPRFSLKTKVMISPASATFHFCRYRSGCRSDRQRFVGPPPTPRSHPTRSQGRLEGNDVTVSGREQTHRK